MEAVTPSTPSPRPLLVLSGLALIGFVLIFIEAGSFGRAARLFPRVVAALGATCSAIVLIQSILRLRAPSATSGATASTLTRSDIIISYIGPIAYALALYVVGFWAASLVCLSGLMILLGERRYWLIAALTLGTLLSIHLVFEWGFAIRMPQGLILETIKG